MANHVLVWSVLFESGVPTAPAQTHGLLGVESQPLLLHLSVSFCLQWQPEAV